MTRLVVYGFLVLGLVAAVGWLKPLFQGPDLREYVFQRTKVVPVPVHVETVKWLTKVKRERVEVPLEVIREVSKAQEKKLEAMKIDIPKLNAEGKELADVLAVPRAPYGGDMALVVDTASGRIDGTFLAKRRPPFELGGIKEAGIEVDPLNTALTAFYRQDFLRVGPAFVSGRVYATASPRYERSGYGATLGVSVRF